AGRRARRKALYLMETARSAGPILGRKGRKARKAAAKAAKKARRRAGSVADMAEARLHKLAS
ncbi:MAG: DoxX subfamily protein, partial [Actinomycetota bacterium]|nr:DoxX subfamily protein [Actinomycetota bacterium]